MPFVIWEYGNEGIRELKKTNAGTQNAGMQECSCLQCRNLECRYAGMQFAKS
jgi:hypothetical protein